ncbi:TolC family outer membrane protein [Granulosicoccus antarcticus]|uniref:Outer membrane protein TolC n=1 Tax=Granulosicoccus antarcticus IMCC3135 TaxID=1192854 RepID=A0A2Z2NYQ0_9GAMM|nr:TolC family outer membrane protein [Granulosicoccus antarcticus]ASJ72897.1 Outer membrane protein TolC [Granulosicoccus antarcticus IMCC3135]
MFAISLLLSVSACAGVGREQDEAAINAKSDRLWVPQGNNAAIEQSTVSGAAQASAAKAQGPVSSYIVQAGDGLADIARRVTGSQNNWQAIAQYNDLANPNALRVGDTLNIPPRFLAGRQTATSADGELDSRIGESGGVVDLLGVLSKAQDYDADFQAAITNRSISQRSLPIARSVQLPQIALGYAGGYYDFESDSSDAYTGQQLTLTLTQSIYDKADAIAVKQAKLTGSVADTQLQAEHEDLVIRVATSYFNVLKAMAELEYRQADVDATRQQLRQTENRYEVGNIAFTDVAEARAQSDLAAASQITARAELDGALEALAVSTGTSVTGDLAPLMQTIPLVSPDPADVDAWVQTAMANNKSLLVARNQIEIAQQQVDQTRAGRLPVVSLTGYLSGVDSDYDASDDVSAGGYTGQSVELGVTLPVFSGGLVSAQIAQEQDRMQLANDQMQAVERQTVQATRDTYRAVVSAVSRVEALSQARQSTRQATQATRSGFEQGTRTSLDVLGSQRDTLRAQTELSAARYDYVLQVLELKRISGTLELADIKRINGWLD